MKRKYIVLAAVNAAALIAFAAFVVSLSITANSLSSQTAAKRWAPDGKSRCSQLSVFYSAGSGTNINGVYTMRVNIDKKLTENSVKAEAEGARTWIDAYSSDTRLEVFSPREDCTIRATAYTTATGGDYFIFHPLKLISGCYYSESDLMHDRVMLDEDLAWQLFGSVNVNGMTVLINQKRFYVAGVVKPDKDKASRNVYGDKPHMYISYDALEKLMEVSPIITCYEAVIPDPVTGLAANIMEEVVSPGDNREIVILENSSRFSLFKLWKIAFDGGTRAVVNTPVVYPFWENAARINEERASVLLVWAASMLIVPLVTIIYFAVLLYRRRKELINKAFTKLRDIAYNITGERRIKRKA